MSSSIGVVQGVAVRESVYYQWEFCSCRLLWNFCFFFFFSRRIFLSFFNERTSGPTAIVCQTQQAKTWVIKGKTKKESEKGTKRVKGRGRILEMMEDGREMEEKEMKEKKKRGRKEEFPVWQSRLFPVGHFLVAFFPLGQPSASPTPKDNVKEASIASAGILNYPDFLSSLWALLGIFFTEVHHLHLLWSHQSGNPRNLPPNQTVPLLLAARMLTYRWWGSVAMN